MRKRALHEIPLSYEIVESTETLDSGTDYNQSKAARRKRVSRSHGSYRNRPFIAVDGEGVNHFGKDKPQSYVLLAASDGSEVASYELGTAQCLGYLIELARRNPGSIFVAYSFNYDVNMIVKDIPREKLHRLRRSKAIYWERWRLVYLQSKMFTITDIERGITICIMDMFTFCACAFAKAVGDHVGPSPELEMVTHGKGKRNVFEWGELDTFIRPYCHAELDLMVQLANSLRDAFAGAGIYPRSWHGPGAIATALLTRERVIDHMTESDPNVQRIAAMAYFGGHFEQYGTGLILGPVYQYDLRSAYPHALRYCPGLRDVKWHCRRQPTDDNLFKIYKVRYNNLGQGPMKPNPFPMRDKNHAVYYPNRCETYVWGPEYVAAMNHFSEYIEVVCVFEIDDPGTRPFAFIDDMYEQRAEWKRLGNPAQLGLKLGLNSIYGKLAQRVGWDQENMRAPKYHQLEWAGFITSYCRAMMLGMLMQSPNNVIALETDGIFTTAPLNVDIGPGLGQVEAEEYNGIIYVQSGMYFTLGDDNVFSMGKSRGLAKKTLKVSNVLDHVTDLSDITVEQIRFCTMGMHIDKPSWRTWQQSKFQVQWGGMGKRHHAQNFCPECVQHSHRSWHPTHNRVPGSPLSHPHSLPWINQDVTNPYQEKIRERQG